MNVPPRPYVHRSRGLAPLIGAFTAGNRKSDPLIRYGFAGAVLAVVFYMWDASLTAERKVWSDRYSELAASFRAIATSCVRQHSE